MAKLEVLRVFTDLDGEHGNPLGVFLDGAVVPEQGRQEVAHELGFSETVFVDDPSSGRMRIFTPAVELPFAGHPCVGLAWLLEREGFSVTTLRPPAGDLPIRLEEGLTWVAARPEWSPPFSYPQFESSAEVDALDPVESGRRGWTYAWAWDDEVSGVVRARSFVAEAGISEDEATGSAALALCSQLGREIEVRQGRGSIIHARPIGDGLVEIGGRVVRDGVTRDYSVESR